MHGDLAKLEGADMSNLLEFRDKMDMYDKESLKIFARDLYIGKTSQLKKADLIEKIAESFLSKESLFRNPHPSCL